MNFFQHKSILTIVLVCAISNSLFSQEGKSRGVPACPKPILYTQPNGDTLTLYLRGDRLIHWYETLDGYPVLKPESKYFEFAVKDADGDLIPSGSIVNKENERKLSDRLRKNIFFSRSQIKFKKDVYFKGDLLVEESDSFPTTGKNNVLVILAEFKDEKFSLPRSRFDSIMNAEDYNGTGSFKDFYLKNSLGKLELISTVTQWVTLPNTKAFYGANDSYGNDSNPKSLARDAIDAAYNQGIDFSKFDNNKNGQVDGVVIIHAGYGEEAGAGDDCIWSHRWNLGRLQVTYDSVRVYDYGIFPELTGGSGKEAVTIGVICHEFGHILGMPDYYDTDYEGSGGDAFDLGNWDLMAAGSWNNDGYTPAGINAYSKSVLKWIDLVELTDKQFIVLNNSLVSDKAYKINTKTENEFFVMENRQQISIDSFIPYHGLIIYHVDNNYIEKHAGYINANPEHQGFDIVEADGIQTLSTIEGDPFPGTSSIHNFTDNTSPYSLSWNNEPSDMPISNITEYADGSISFYANYSSSELAVLNKVTFYINNGKKPIVNALVTINNVGIYTDSKGAALFIFPDTSNISYTVSADGYADYAGNIDFLSGNATKIISLTTSGIDEILNDFILYPNPFSSRLYIKGEWKDFSNYDIYDNAGQKIFSGEINSNNIDLNFLDNGIYIIFMYSKTNIYPSKRQLLIKID